MKTIINELVSFGYLKQALLSLNQDELAVLKQEAYVENRFPPGAARKGGLAAARNRRRLSPQSHFEQHIQLYFQKLGGQKVKFTSINQKHNTPEALYKHAEQMKPSFDNGLNHGKGVDKALGAKVHRPASQEDFNKALRSKGPVVILAPLKGKTRAAEKVDDKYGGDWSRLSDVVRATVGVDHAKDLTKATSATIEHMKSQGWKVAEQENRTSNHLSGYRDIALKFKKNGHIAEVQINTKPMLRAKEVGIGHKMYEEMRTIDQSGKKKLKDMTPTERSRYVELQKKCAILFHAAWRASTKHPVYKATYK